MKPLLYTALTITITITSGCSPARYQYVDKFSNPPETGPKIEEVFQIEGPNAANTGETILFKTRGCLDESLILWIVSGESQPKTGPSLVTSFIQAGTITITAVCKNKTSTLSVKVEETRSTTNQNQNQNR